MTLQKPITFDHLIPKKEPGIGAWVERQLDFLPGSMGEAWAIHPGITTVGALFVGVLMARLTTQDVEPFNSKHLIVGLLAAILWVLFATNVYQ